MHIAIDARMLETGVGRYIYELLTNLEELDSFNQYTVIIQPKDRTKWHPTKPNFEVVELDAPIYTVAEQVKLAWLLYKLRPDLVHFCAPNSPILYLGRQITTIHDLTLLKFRHPRKQLSLYHLNVFAFSVVVWVAAHISKHLITPTQYVKDEVVERYRLKPDKVTVTHEAGFTPNTKPTPFAPVQGKRFLFYIGNDYPYKNLWRLVDAFGLIGDPDLYLVLGGKKNVFYGRLEAHAKTNNIANVIFPGFLSDGEISWLHDHAQAYVFPSLSEGFGLPGLEAMEHGLPVISSSATCLPEVYGDAAVYFDPYDTEDMVRVIKNLLDDKKRQAELKKAGLARVKQFSWKRMAEQTLAIYKNVLGQK